MPDLIHAEQALTETDLTTFEASLKRPLPEAFKRHYLASNGGEPSEADAEAGKWGLPVHGFNPLRYGRLTIEMLMEDYGTIAPPDSPYGRWTKPDFIPFAYDAGANPIFLSLRPEDYGCVYIYAPDGGAVKRIAGGFGEFLSRLFRTQPD